MIACASSDLQVSIHDWFAEVLANTTMPQDIKSLLQRLKEKHLPTYEHSLRVGRLAWYIGKLTKNDALGLQLAALCHDIGKLETPLFLLEKCPADWNASDSEMIKKHVMDGFDMVLPHAGLTAHIIVRHHRWQEDPYPQTLPQLPDYLLLLGEEIERLSGLLSMADCYDCLKYGFAKNGQNATVPGMVRPKLMLARSNHIEIIEQAYEAGIFSESNII